MDNPTEPETGQGGEPEAPEAEPPQIDPAKLEQFVQELRENQNLPMGVVGGVVGMVVGTAVWVLVTVFTGYQIGWMAVAVGALVGVLVRVMGKGLDSVFGVVGAALALVGCVAGNLLSGCYFVAEADQVGFMDVVRQLTPALAIDILKVMFSPIDLLFYGIAVYEGYRFSFRRVSEQEMIALVQDEASPGGAAAD